MKIRYFHFTLCLLLVHSVTASAQVPGGYRWWDGPIAKDLGLTPDQSNKVRATVRASRPQLIQLRASVQVAEAELKDELAADQVDRVKAGEAIERVVKTRGELMRAVSQMSLNLRMVLTASQWRELERRQPRRAGPARTGRGQPAEALPLEADKPPED